MATKNPGINRYRKVATRKRPGIHAKTKTSRNKTSRLYRKAYVGQG